MSEHHIFNDSVLLTAEDLAKHCSSSKVLPRGGGEKCYAPSGTWLEEKQLDNLLQERIDMLAEERIVTRNDLSLGEWQPETSCVLLTKGKGKLFQHMGFHLNGKHLLYPVEALFLMESSVLQVTYNGFPLSIEQSYALFLTDGFDKFHVYSHMSRMGYTVTIYKKRDYDTSSANTEKKLKPDPSEKSAGETSPKVEKIECKETNINSPLQPQSSTSAVGITSSHERIQTDSGTKEIMETSTKPDSKQFCQKSLNSSLTRKTSSTKCVHGADFPFPIYLPGQKIVLNRPPSHLLPKHVRPSRPSYILSPDVFQQVYSKKTVVESRRGNTNSEQQRRPNEGSKNWSGYECPSSRSLPTNESPRQFNVQRPGQFHQSHNRNPVTEPWRGNTPSQKQRQDKEGNIYPPTNESSRPVLRPDVFCQSDNRQPVTESLKGTTHSQQQRRYNDGSGSGYENLPSHLLPTSESSTRQYFIQRPELLHLLNDRPPVTEPWSENTPSQQQRWRKQGTSSYEHPPSRLLATNESASSSSYVQRPDRLHQSDDRIPADTNSQQQRRYIEGGNNRSRFECPPSGLLPKNEHAYAQGPDRFHQCDDRKPIAESWRGDTLQQQRQDTEGIWSSYQSPQSHLLPTSESSSGPPSLQRPDMFQPVVESWKGNAFSQYLRQYNAGNERLLSHLLPTNEDIRQSYLQQLGMFHQSDNRKPVTDSWRGNTPSQQQGRGNEKSNNWSSYEGPPSHLLSRNESSSTGNPSYVQQPDMFHQPDGRKPITESWEGNTKSQQQRWHNEGNERLPSNSYGVAQRQDMINQSDARKQVTESSVGTTHSKQLWMYTEGSWQSYEESPHLSATTESSSNPSYVKRPERFHQSDAKTPDSETWRGDTHSQEQRRYNHNQGSNNLSRQTLSQRNDPSSSRPKRRKPNYTPIIDLDDYPSAIPRLQLTINDWKEFKSEVGMSAKSGWALFVKDVKPLIQTVLSTDELHSEIKLVKEADFTLLVDKFSNSDNISSCQIKIDFDVYLPNVPFKKSKPSPPGLRLSVINSQQEVPSLLDVSRLQIDDVPLYFAVVDNGEVNFYGFQPVTLCPVKPMS